jgi:hypothetical protein
MGNHDSYSDCTFCHLARSVLSQSTPIALNPSRNCTLSVRHPEVLPSKAVATAPPMPLEAPVTIATFSDSLLIIHHCS